MTESLLPADMLEAFGPGAVSPAMLVLTGDDAPTRTTLCAGAGAFEAAHITLTQGVYVGIGDDAADRLLQALPRVIDRQDEMVPASGSGQGANELRLAQGG
jgi:hypothetical protein